MLIYNLTNYLCLDQLKFDPVKLKEGREMTEIMLPFKLEKKEDITFECVYFKSWRSFAFGYLFVNLDIDLI